MIGDLYALYQWDKLETAKESRDFPPPKKKEIHMIGFLLLKINDMRK
jgi:hypothetical protein